MSDSPRTCSLCGDPVPTGFPEGLCPRCLLEGSTMAMEPGAGPGGTEPPLGDTASSRAATSPGTPPTAPESPSRSPLPEELQAWFPGLEILELLGTGGMGAVYRARQPRLNRSVALKILSCPAAHYADFAMRFEREAQLMARLNHPHIVTIYDFGEVDRSAAGEETLFYFLMEFVDGTDLNRLIRSGGLKPEEALRLVPQICEALQFAHDEGITHRDIKPANILVDRKGHVKIADFGLAKLVRGEETLAMGLTMSGTTMGTPHYMAPEQWEHPEAVDHRADIFSLGVVIYEMLTGERPAGVFAPPSKKTSPPVDKRLDGIVLRAMEKDPAQRYQQAGEVMEDVTRIAKRIAPPSRFAATRKKGKGGLVGRIVGLGVVVALVAGGWALWGEKESGDNPDKESISDTPPVLTPLVGTETLPAREWVKVDWPGQSILVGGKPARNVTPEEIAKEGGLRLVKDDLWIGSQVPLIGKVQNGGIRLRWKRLSDTGGLSVSLRGASKATVNLNGSTNATVYYGGVSSGGFKQGLAHGGLAPVGEEMLMEVVCVGRRLVMKRDGLVTGTLELPEAALGDFLRFQGSEVVVIAAELINLDGLSEAEALKVAGVEAAALPASVQKGSAPTFPPGRWTKVLSTQAELDSLPHLKGQVALRDGWLDSSLSGSAPGIALESFDARNAGLRLTGKIADVPPPPMGIVAALRQGSTQNGTRGHYRLQIAGMGSKNPTAGVAHYDNGTRETSLLTWKFLPKTLEVGDEFRLEFFAIGNRLIGRYNGELLPIVEDKRLGTGLLSLQTVHLMRDIEVINLDGLSEAEALKVAGVESSSLPVSTGRLRAAGTMSNGKTPALDKFAAYDDFVDVVASREYWMALRANGETVSSDGKADFQGIARIARSFQNYHCFIDKTGGLRFRPEREMELPDSLKGRAILDAACGIHHGVALLEGGKAAVFGRRYEEAVEDASPTPANATSTPRWPQPEATALEDVQGVAVTYTHAATLHHDGTVSVWGWQGRVKWQPDPEMKAVRQISSNHDALHLLDEARQVWSLPLPRSAHPEQPVSFDGRPKRLGTGAVRLRDHLWLDTDGAWQAVAADLPTVETLRSAPLRPETNFALLASPTGPQPFGYVLWIEPGVPASKSKPVSTFRGHLRGSGSHLDGTPLDLKNAEGITDFVQVILTDKSWVGLRADGTAVFSDGNRSTTPKIARLLPAWYDGYGTIDAVGRLSIEGGGASAEVKTIPEEVQRIGVVDARWEIGQAIALLRDGTARVWGEQYSTGKDGSKWPAPPAEALQDVRKIAITRDRAATLCRDGKWYVWGGNDGESGPYDLTPYATWGEIADIESNFAQFRVMTREGKVYNLGGGRPLSSGLAAEEIKDLRGEFLLPKASLVWTWTTKKRAAAQAEVDALLMQIGTRQKDAWDLRIVGEEDASKVAAVWIESVAAPPKTTPAPR